LGADYNRLVSVAGSAGEPGTLAEFKSRFAARVEEATAEFTPTHQRVARRVLADLDAVAGPVGRRVADVEPAQGMVAMYGSPDQEGFTIWRYDEGWKRWYGKGEQVTNCVVTSTPGSDAPADEAAAIAEFKSQVWEQGQAVKQRFKWCSVFDTVLAEFGITDPNPPPDFSSWTTLVKAQEGRDKLPVGAVIGDAKGDWGVFVKTSNEHNSAEDWTRVCGTRPLAAGTMRLLGENGIIGPAPLLEVLPEGTEVTTDGGSTYIKGDDGQWGSAGVPVFRHPSNAFAGVGGVRVTSLPV
jgi:hypothetical protein